MKISKTLKLTLLTSLLVMSVNSRGQEQNDNQSNLSNLTTTITTTTNTTNTTNDTVSVPTPEVQTDLVCYFPNDSDPVKIEDVHQLKFNDQQTELGYEKNGSMFMIPAQYCTIKIFDK